MAVETKEISRVHITKDGAELRKFVKEEHEGERRSEIAHKKFASILRYLPHYSPSSDPHSDILEIARRIRRDKANGGAPLETLAEVGRFCETMAPIRLHYLNKEKRWEFRRKEDKAAEKSKRKDLYKGMRRYDRESEIAHDGQKIELLKRNSQYYEGREEWTAMMILDITDPKRKKEFIKRLLNGKTTGDERIIGSYYRGPMSVNNVLFETLIMGESAGKKIAYEIADTLDRLRGEYNKVRLINDPNGFALDICRLYFLAGKEHYTSFMRRIRAEDSSLYECIRHNNPEEMMLYSGSLSRSKSIEERIKHGLTLSDRLEITRRNVIRALQNCNGNGKTKA